MFFFIPLLAHGFRRCPAASGACATPRDDSFAGWLGWLYSLLMPSDTDTTSSAWTIGRLLNWTADHLARANVADARLSSEVLLSHAAGCRRIDLYARFDQVLEGPPLDRFRAWVRRAAEGEPIAYLVEEKEFFSLPLFVTRDVLIPRPETEVLVECVIDHCTKAGLDRPVVLDLGTGSGCIAVALLKHLSQARVVGTDVSAAALAVAQRNAERHAVMDRLTLLEADCLSLAAETIPEGGFDALVSNPPYVPVGAWDGLDRSVRDFEPRHALTDESDGLSFYRAIGADGPGLLKPAGAVFVEIDDGVSDGVASAIEEGGGLVHKRTWKDRVVGHERVLLFGRRADAADQEVDLEGASRATV